MGSRTSAARCLVAALIALTGACTSPGAQRIIGPDGSPMVHVHCGSDQGTCFRLAGELCPSGYDLKPTLTGYDGNFLVRCRAAAPPVVVAASACEGPARPAAAKARDTWPPTSEPWPATYPWAPPDASAAARSPAGAPPAPAPLEIDLGY